MKTFNFLNVKTITTFLTVTTALLTVGNASVLSQEVKSVFGKGSKIGFIWGMELKTATIQHELGTEYKFYAGALYNHAATISFTGALNVTHPTVNYGYIGVMAQYTYKVEKLVHPSAQITVGAGTTKDYEQEKTSTFDNFGNITGTGFYFIEPGINGEINLGARTRFNLGIAYRLVNGLNQNNQYVSQTHVSNRDLSALYIHAGITFGLY